MARRTVKVKLDKYKPEEFLKLCKAVISMNTALGPESPLADGEVVNMADFEARVAEAAALRKEAQDCYARMQSCMEKSRSLLGTAVGQSSLSENTCLYDLTRIKKLLLILNNENPEALSPWGFDVVVSTARRPTRRKKQEG